MADRDDRVDRANRVSVRAVLAQDGELPVQALLDAGIYEPISVPVVMGEHEPHLDNGILGDGLTENLTAVLETEMPEDGDQTSANSSPSRSMAQHDAPTTATLPSTYGLRPMAPVRVRTS